MASDGMWCIVTGASSGIGLASSRLLASRGVNVVMACRSLKRADRAVRGSRSDVRARLHPLHLDLADLNTIGTFVDELSKLTDRIHVLVNNAGVMEPPYGTTAQGHELQFGVNHLGHFALTMALLPFLETAQTARVVTVSSLAAEHGHLEPPYQSTREEYDRASSYRNSKLANLLFAAELQRQLRKRGANIISIALHPGYVRTRLQRHVPGGIRKLHAFITRQLKAQPAIEAALLVQEAAMSHALKGGEYVVPSGPDQLRGPAVIVRMPRQALDLDRAGELWAYSEACTDRRPLT